MAELSDIVFSIIGGVVVAGIIESILFIKKERNRQREITTLREFLINKEREILHTRLDTKPTDMQLSKEHISFAMYKAMLREETILFLKYPNLKPKELYEISNVFTTAKSIIEELGLNRTPIALKPEFYNEYFFTPLEELKWLNFKRNNDDVK